MSWSSEASGEDVFVAKGSYNLEFLIEEAEGFTWSEGKEFFDHGFQGWNGFVSHGGHGGHGG